jgi:hypothetical protein
LIFQISKGFWARFPIPHRSTAYKKASDIQIASTSA